MKNQSVCLFFLRFKREEGAFRGRGNLKLLGSTFKPLNKNAVSRGPQSRHDFNINTVGLVARVPNHITYYLGTCSGDVGGRGERKGGGRDARPCRVQVA